MFTKKGLLGGGIFVLYSFDLFDLSPVDDLILRFFLIGHREDKRCLDVDSHAAPDDKEGAEEHEEEESSEYDHRGDELLQLIVLKCVEVDPGHVSRCGSVGVFSLGVDDRNRECLSNEGTHIFYYSL